MFPLSGTDSVCLHLHAVTANVTFHSIDRLFQLYMWTVQWNCYAALQSGHWTIYFTNDCSEIQLNKCHPSNDLLWWKIEGWNPIWVEQYHQLPIAQGFWQLKKMGGVHMVAFAFFALCLFSCRPWAQWVLTMLTECFGVALAWPSVVLLFLHEGVDGCQLKMISWLGR